MSEHRQLGRIRIARPLLGLTPDCQRVFSRFVPVETRYDYERDEVEYLGFSADFDAVHPSEMAPSYRVVLTPESLTFERT